MPLNRKISLGIHKLISGYIQTRSSQQCRSHHQKMLLKYKTIGNIILSEKHESLWKQEAKLSEDIH